MGGQSISRIARKRLGEEVAPTGARGQSLSAAPVGLSSPLGQRAWALAWRVLQPDLGAEGRRGAVSCRRSARFPPGSGREGLAGRAAWL